MKTKLLRVFSILVITTLCLSFVLPRLIADHPLIEVLIKGIKQWDDLALGDDAQNENIGDGQGVRFKYAVLKELLSIEQIGELVGEPVFLEGGPHDYGINYDDKINHGQYNPAFLMKVKSILQDVNKNPVTHRVLQTFYNNKLEGMARGFYRGHQYLEQEGNLQRIKYNNFDYTFSAYSNVEEALEYDGWEAFAIPEFWLRRQSDGTDKLFFEILTMVLEDYDAEFLNGEPTTNHLLHKLGQGIAGWNSFAWIRSKDLSYEEDGTTIDDGLRYQYAVLKKILSIEVLEKLTGEKVFVKGPHGAELDYDADEFGHYNVVFLERMKGTLYRALDSKIFNRFGQKFYDKQLKGMVRAYHHAYLFIQEQDNVEETYGGTYNRTLSNQYAYSAESKGFDWFNSNTAVGFWGRRTTDGTIGYFEQMMNTVLDKYDPGYRN